MDYALNTVQADCIKKIVAMDFVAKGNKKLPSTTWIVNSGSATDCPSLAMGLCQAGAKCYALKAEVQYPGCLPYRRRQEELYRTVTPAWFAGELLKASARSRTSGMLTFRYNEAGDFRNQDQLQWFADVCQILSGAGVRCYGYTARTDLDLLPLLAVARVNVSNDGGGWIARGANRFLMVDSHTPGAMACAGNCRLCELCHRVTGKTIEVAAH